MYPPSKREALLGQLQTEKALTDLAMYCYRHWLPAVRLAVFPSLTAAAEDELPPDPNGVSETQSVWEYLLDHALLYGLGLLYGAEVLAAYAALGDGEEPPASSAPPDIPPPVLAPGGVPDVPDIEAEVRRVVANRLARTLHSVEQLASTLDTVPSVRQLQAAYLADVRNRMVGTPDVVFREIAMSVDEGLAAGESPLVIRDRVQKHLDITTGDWRGRATTVARTEAAGAQSSATLEAAQLQAEALGEENLEKVWITTLDSRTRKTHLDADGQRIPLAGRFTVGRAELRHPADAAGPPEETINCRCRVGVLAADEASPRRSRTASAAPPGGTLIGEFLDSVRDSLPPTHPAYAALADDPTEEKTVAEYRTFTAVLAVIGTETDDGRMFAADIDLSFRDMPLPLLWQKQSDIGHFNSYTVGVIETAAVEGTDVVGTGYLLNTPEADEAATQIEHKITGPSVDLGDVSWILTDENGDEVDWDLLWDNPDMKVIETITAGKLLGATLVSIPAFGQTSITLGAVEERGAETEAVAAALVASVAQRFAEPTYPGEFFADPGFTEPTPLHMTDDGRICGHLAVFGVCHVGIQDRCVMAPRSATGYAWYHTSPPVLTEGGDRVKVGRLTVGGGHADGRLGVGPAVAHYDDVGTCFALVHAGEDEHGIWVSGVPAPGVSKTDLARGLAAPLSGDWRAVGGNLELVAALSVNTPGYPIVASGATDAADTPLSLIASLGPCRDTGTGVFTREQMRGFAKEVAAEVAAIERRRARAQTLVARGNRHRARALIARAGR